MHLRIAHLYPDILNIYGDRGNIIALKQRCQWRGIKVTVKNISLGTPLQLNEFDLFFGGGGQDRQQLLVAHDLQKKKKAIKQAVDNHKVFLLICGTYQLFGHYFIDGQGRKIPGLGILDIKTVASKQRKIGNILIKTSFSLDQATTDQLIGFENHIGSTFINSKGNTQPLGKVIKGFGNNGQDKTEGAVHKNVYCTYLHGSLLPKNPHFADFLIQTALRIRYQNSLLLKPLNDQLEHQAHQHVARHRT